MAQEIERKFLLCGDDWRNAPAISIRQGYLSRDAARTVRVRTSGDNAWLTIKGKSKGAVRAEFEYAIPLADANALLALCERPLIEKNRHIIEYAGMTWEIDEFFGENRGLIVAEIELESEDQVFERPHWIGEEVTDDPRYYNSQLSLTPYSEWMHGDTSKTR